MEHAVVIFSGYNMRAVIAFLRVAIKYKVPVIIIATSKEDIIFQTKYSKFVAYTREKNDINSIKDIPKIITNMFSYTKYIILPSTESLNRFILENRDYFMSYNFYIPLVEKELYEKISNKKTFYELCKNNYLEVPEEISKIDGTTFPVVLKPNYYNYDNPLKPIIFLILMILKIIWIKIIKNQIGLYNNMLMEKVFIYYIILDLMGIGYFMVKKI